MEMKTVNSSNLAAVGYDSNSQIMRVEFNNGGIYEYYNVPQEKYEELIVASSVGSYFHHNIKNGGYKFSKIS